MDADGFVTVSYKKAVKRKFVEATEEEKEELAKSKGRNKKKKRSEKELKNFYRFQKREAKRGGWKFGVWCLALGVKLRCVRDR